MEQTTRVAGPPLTPIATKRSLPIAGGRRSFSLRRSSSTAKAPDSSPLLGPSGITFFEEGTYAWLPDKEEVVIPVKIFQTFRRGEKGMVVRMRPNESNYHVNEEETNRRRKLSIGSRQKHHLRPSLTTMELKPEESETLVRADETSLIPAANLVDMVDLSEATLLHNLRLRFHEKMVYTSIGTILVSVNPFEALPLYTPDMVDKYRLAGSHINRAKLGPHVYALAHDAFANMIDHRQDQSCIVTGESGSGKTELTKLFLQYLMEISKTEEDEDKKQDNDSFDEAKAEEKGGGLDIEEDLDFRELPLSTRILTANPLLEAFGNAMTMRNDNSSRHGKWISVMFHKKKGSVMGANIQVYLLEKSRLVHRGASERNFHIFYQLMAAASSDQFLRESLQLEGGVEAFRFLTSLSEEIAKDNLTVTTTRLNDARSWAQTLRSLRSIGITRVEEGQLLQVLAGLLHMGNAEFAESNDGASYVTNKDVLDVASELLGLDGALIETSLTKKDMSNSKEKIFQNRSSAQAREARDALAKFIYAKLFDWVVAKIGVALGPSDESRGIPSSTIGMLDVFGFEVFERNSFEQLCINYANEKLQEQFNRKVFEMEREEYIAQGMGRSEVDALFSHISNAQCLAMFEARPSGLFATLEDEIFVPKGTDAGFLSKVARSAPPTCFAKIDDLKFRVTHYAGGVEYDAMGFLNKSSDRIDPLLENLPGKSTGLLSRLVGASQQVSGPSVSPAGSRKKEQKTLGMKFVAQLSELLDALDTTEPHYARCIKPNDLKSPMVFKAQMVMSQLRYAGLLDVCRVRKRGYPFRLNFDEFAWRYGHTVAVNTAQAPTRNQKEKCEVLLRLSGIEKQEGFAGSSKILLKHTAYDLLELKRDEALRQSATLIQKLARGRLSRASVAEVKSALSKLGRLVTEARSIPEVQVMKELDEQLHVLREVPLNHPTIVAALAVKKRIEGRSLVVDLINKAVTYQEAQVAKKEAVSLGIHPDDPCLSSVNIILARQTEMSQLKSELEMAMETRDFARLDRALSVIDSLAGTGNSPANRERHRSTSFTQETVSDARALRDRLKKEKDATEEVERAIATDAGIDELKRALKGMITLNMDKHPVALDAAKLLKRKKRKENESKDLTALRTKGSEDTKQTLIKLKQAENARDLKALTEARHEAIELGLDRVPDVQKASRLIQQLEDANDLETSLAAATDMVITKANFKSGTALSYLDLERLKESILVAKQRGIIQDAPEYLRAIETERDCRAQLKVQLGLEEALKDRNYAKVNLLLQDSARLGMDNDLIRRARAVSSKRNGGDNGARIGRTVSLRDRAQEMKKLSQKEFEKRRMERLREARDIKHDWWKLEEKGIIRSSEDFATKRGNMFSSKVDKRVARSKWKYSGKLIPKSLTVRCDQDERTAKRAVLMNKAILGFCGDLVLPFPSVLAQQILEAALLDPPLADELWVQLLRQLTENPYEDSERRAWMLCAVCASCVGPSSKDVEDAVLHFLIIQAIESAGVLPLNKEYARYVLRRFEKIIIEGPSGAIPTSEEIQTFQERPPMLATVSLPDGSELIRDFPVASDVTVQELVEACCVTMEIRTDLAFLFGLFVEVKAQEVTHRRSRTLKRAELASTIDSPSASYPSASPQAPASPGGSALKSGSSGASKTNRNVSFEVDSPSPKPQSVARRVSTTMLKPLFSSSDKSNRSSLSIQAIPEAESLSQSLVVSDEAAPQVLGAQSSRLKLAPSKSKLRTKNLPERVPEPLAPGDFLGDILMQNLGRGERLQFIFRRKIVSLPGQEPPGALNVKSFLEVSYIEAVEEFLCGNWACSSKEEAAELAAFIISENRGGKPPTSIGPNMGLALREFLPVPWRDEAPAPEWSRLVTAAFARVKAVSQREVRKGFLSRIERLPSFGLICFPVRRGSNELIIFGCGARGIVIMEASRTRKQTLLVPHRRVRKVLPFAESISIDITDEALTRVQERLSFVTAQAHEIAALLWDYGTRFN